MRACKRPSPGTLPAATAAVPAENMVNLYIWTDYLAPNTLSMFGQITAMATGEACVAFDYRFIADAQSAHRSL